MLGLMERVLRRSGRYASILCLGCMLIVVVK